MATYELTLGPKPVCTKGSTTVAMTAPATGPLHGRRVKSVRPHVFLDSNSGNAQVRVGYQTSNDGVTWAPTSALSSWISAAGWTRATAWTSATAAPFARIVVEAQNGSGTDLECVRVTLLIEVSFG